MLLMHCWLWPTVPFITQTIIVLIKRNLLLKYLTLTTRTHGRDLYHSNIQNHPRYHAVRRTRAHQFESNHFTSHIIKLFLKTVLLDAFIHHSVLVLSCPAFSNTHYDVRCTNNVPNWFISLGFWEITGFVLGNFFEFDGQVVGSLIVGGGGVGGRRWVGARTKKAWWEINVMSASISKCFTDF